MHDSVHQKHNSIDKFLITPIMILILLVAACGGGKGETRLDSPVVKVQHPKPTVVKPSAPVSKPASPAIEKPFPDKSTLAGVPKFWQHMPQMMEFHQYNDGLRWRLTSSGIEVESANYQMKPTNQQVIQNVWNDYGKIIEKWSTHYEVPFELIMTAVCVESSGRPKASNAKNVGLMQTLVSTAQSALKDKSITWEDLYDPSLAIKAGTAYMAMQFKSTGYDPPKVAAAYNAGSLRSGKNPWAMRQYGIHIDKTVAWFNVILAFVAEKPNVPPVSFARYFREK